MEYKGYINPDCDSLTLNSVCVGTDPLTGLYTGTPTSIDFTDAVFHIPNTVKIPINKIEKHKKEWEIFFSRHLPDIVNVIFNDPATIVFWSDGTKTVVKASNGDVFNPEIGLAMAVAKRALGNKGSYNNIMRQWLPKEEADA